MQMLETKIECPCTLVFKLKYGYCQVEGQRWNIIKTRTQKFFTQLASSF